MRKIIYTILIGLITVVTGCLIKYLEKEKNRKLVYAHIKRYSGNIKKLVRKKEKEISL